MKRIFALIIALIMMLTFASCTGGVEVSKEESTSTADFLVGAIYIGSQNDTAGYTYAHHNGIVTAMKEIGLDPETQLRIVDNVAEENTAVTNALNALKNQGCKIIFGISFGYIDAFNEAAQNPDFAGVILSHATGYLASDDSGEYATSFNNYFGRIYQARYLTGIAAGLKSLELGNDSIGYVAAYGTEYAETCSGINAFALGVQAVNPNATVYVKTLNTWGDETLEKAAAESLIETFNCCVISQHCDSSQPQQVANNAGVFGCGYNSDMTADAPNAHLVAAIWNWNVYYHTAIECAMSDPDNFMSEVGVYYGGIKEGFVDISAITENCSVGTADAIEKVKTMIINGEWDVFSGVQLYITVTDGVATVETVEGELLKNDDTPCGDIDDGIIKGSMNYFVKGVTKV